MSRVRLTARGRQSADQTPYPGSVNQPDRNDPAWDEYHTFEQKTNHELPDMRHDWQNDGRDDIGFGIPEAWGKSPTVASVRVAANKAVRLAVLLLGDKVSDEVIEAQARDIMAIGPKAMDRTLQRFADTQKLYAEDEKKDEAEEKKAADEKVDEKKVEDEKKAADAAKFTPEIAVPGSEEQPKKAADEKKDEKVDEKVDEKAKCAAEDEAKKDEEKKASDLKAMIAGAVAEALKAALPDFIQKKVDEKKDDAKDEKKDDEKASETPAPVKAADEKVDEAKKDEEKKAADESEKKDEKVDEKKASAEPKRAMGEFDIELSAAMEDEPAPDPEADERLASLFDDPTVAAAGTSDRKVEASQKKVGITKLGGQPRVASAGTEGVDISSIWQSAPDVSEAFK